MSTSSKKVTVGYWYSLGLHMGLCCGPIDSLVEIKVGDKEAFKGEIEFEGEARINKRNLFGGADKEGGMDGTAVLLSGSPDMPRHEGLTAMLDRKIQDGLVPAFRGIASVYWDGWIIAMNPYLKPWKFRLRRTTEGWENNQSWYADKAAIWLEAGGDTIKAMNPAHILYQVYSDSRMGRGLPPYMFDEEVWREAADRLYDEGFGLCLKWTRQDTIEAFAQIVLDHIGGAVYIDRQTGLICLKLIRDDYDPEELQLFTVDTGLLQVELEISTLLTQPNEIIVKYVSPLDGEEREVRAKSTASLAYTGGSVISEVHDYPGLPTVHLASRVAMRDLKMAVNGIKKFTLRLDRRAALISPGDVFRIAWPDLGIENVVLRAGRIEYGEGTDGTITIVALQDIFGLPATSYYVEEKPAYVPQDFEPHLAPESIVFEAPYRELLINLGPAETERLNVHSTYIAALATSPSGIHTGFYVVARAGMEPYAISQASMGTFCPVATLTAPLSINDTVATLAFPAGVPRVEIGSAAMIGGEIVRVDAISPIMGWITLGRGCLDTVPKKHPQGTLIWFYGSNYDIAYNNREFTPGVASAKILTQVTNGAVLPEDVVSPVPLTLTGRQGRPYPPGRFRINGQAHPETITAPLTVSWAHRNRLVQADSLVDTEYGSFVPETGTTYNLRIRDDSGITYFNEHGLTGTDFTWDMAEPADLALLHFNGNTADVVTGNVWSGSPVFNTGGRFGQCVELANGAALQSGIAYPLGDNWTLEFWLNVTQGTIMGGDCEILRIGSGSGYIYLSLVGFGALEIGVGTTSAQSARCWV